MIETGNYKIETCSDPEGFIIQKEVIVKTWFGFGKPVKKWRYVTTHFEVGSHSSEWIRLFASYKKCIKYIKKRKKFINQPIININQSDV